MKTFWLNKYKSIVIEGPIGVGKTSLTKKIAKIFSIPTLLEAAEENPFLEKFYLDSKKFALQTQLFFLFQRLDQIQHHLQRDLFAENTISDFMLEKDPIFATLTLNDEELFLYQKIYQSQITNLTRPDLVIYLQAEPIQLYERIKKRGNPIELNISSQYLHNLCSAYNKFFYQYSDAPILVVNTASFNPIDNEKDFDSFINQIGSLKGKRTFFNSTR
tara:strand:+ start:1942 stop:2592 length:651 start_codon:yes stop_codon:yes gene_type:complete